MLQPVLSNVPVNQRIGHDRGKAENEKQTHGNGGDGRSNKEAEVMAHQFAHRGNIAVLTFWPSPTGSTKRGSAEPLGIIGLSSFGSPRRVDLIGRTLAQRRV